MDQTIPREIRHLDGRAHKKSLLSLSTLQALFCFKNPAIPTFALVYTIIGSESLTTVFGMGTGDPFRYGHREGVTKALACRDPCWIGKCQIILQPQL